jgi:hypothetical protein
MATPTPIRITDARITDGVYLPTFQGALRVERLTYEDVPGFGRLPTWAHTGKGWDASSWAISGSDVVFASPEEADAYREARAAQLLALGS